MSERRLSLAQGPVARTRFTRRRAVGAGLAGLASAALASPWASRPAAAATKMKLGHATAVESPQHLAAQHMAQRARELSGGALDITVYPGSTLGTDQQMINLTRGGSIDICFSGSSNFNGVVPSTTALELPFLFRDGPHAYKVLDGDIGQGIFQEFEPKGLRGLSYFENGWRVMSNNRHPIHTPDDTKGLKIRSTPNPFHLQAFQLLGMNPSPLAISELYAALEQRSFDAQEHPLPVFWTSKFYEVQKYLSMTNHAYSPILAVANERTFKALSPAHQKALVEAAQDGARMHREINTRDIDTIIGKLKERKFEVVEKIDMEPFRALVNPPVRKAFIEKFGSGLIDRIDKA